MKERKIVLSAFVGYFGTIFFYKWLSYFGMVGVVFFFEENINFGMLPYFGIMTYKEILKFWLSASSTNLLE